jgi:protein required for attachment to host cells
LILINAIPTFPGEDDDQQGKEMPMAKPVQPRVWVLIADGEHARVATPGAVEGQFHTLLAFDSSTAHMRSRDLTSDGPGRSFESGSPTRHAVTPKTDAHEEAKRRFVHEVARFAEERSRAGEFDRLVLVAPPHALHELRESLGKAVMGKVVGSLNKDLVKTKDHDLGAHLAEWWVAPPAG